MNANAEGGAFNPAQRRVPGFGTLRFFVQEKLRGTEKAKVCKPKARFVRTEGGACLPIRGARL